MNFSETMNKEDMIENQIEEPQKPYVRDVLDQLEEQASNYEDFINRIITTFEIEKKADIFREVAKASTQVKEIAWTPISGILVEKGMYCNSVDRIYYSERINNKVSKVKLLEFFTLVASYKCKYSSVQLEGIPKIPYLYSVIESIPEDKSVDEKIKYIFTKMGLQSDEDGEKILNYVSRYIHGENTNADNEDILRASNFVNNFIRTYDTKLVHVLDFVDEIKEFVDPGKKEKIVNIINIEGPDIYKHLIENGFDLGLISFELNVSMDKLQEIRKIIEKQDEKQVKPTKTVEELEKEEARRKAVAKRKAKNIAKRKEKYEAVKRQEEEEEAKRIATKEARKKAAEEETRKKAEQEAKEREEQEARKSAEQEAREKTTQEAKRKADREVIQRFLQKENEKRKAAEEERRKAEQEAKKRAEQEAREREEQEAKRKAEYEELKRKAKQEAARRQEEEQEAKNNSELSEQIGETKEIENTENNTKNGSKVNRAVVKIGELRRNYYSLYNNKDNKALPSAIDKTKGYIDTIRNNVSNDILAIIDDVCKGTLNIEKAKQIIDEEAEKRMKENRNFIARTKKQQKQQVIMQLLILIKNNGKIINPEVTIQQLEEICEGDLAGILNSVAENYINKGDLNTAKVICGIFAKREMNPNLSATITTLRKKISGLEIGNMVLRLINSNGTQEEMINCFKIIENGLERAKIAKSAVNLGTTKDGLKIITLADIWKDEKLYQQ